MAHARAGRDARIVLKLNALVDVAVDRGALPRLAGRRPTSTSSSAARCSLQPGIPGVSDNIRVRSIVGEFLEHSRIWGFENGGDARVVHRLGRPDGPQPRPAGRGRRPGRGPRGAARLAEIIDLMLADDRRSWQLLPDGVVASGPRTSTGRPGTIDTFEVAQGAGAQIAQQARRPATTAGAGAGSLDPRA